MKPEDLIKIEITTPEAVLFRSFMEFNQTFALMVSSGVFDIRNGSATINFDALGNISSIERKDSLYNVRVK